MTPVRSNQFSSFDARPSYAARPSARTAVRRATALVPRCPAREREDRARAMSHGAGRRRLVAYAVVMRSSSSGHVEGMAADPMPASRRLDVRWTIGSLTPVSWSPGKTVRPRRLRQVSGIIRLEQVSPPMLAGRLGCRADVEAPPSIIRSGRWPAAHRGRIEAGLVQVSDRASDARRRVSGRSQSRRGRRDRCARGRRSRSCRRRRAPRWRPPAHQPTPDPGAGTATTAAALPGSGIPTMREMLRDRPCTVHGAR